MLMLHTPELRDDADVKKLEDWFHSHDPFSDVDAILSIATGVIGDENINMFQSILFCYFI